MAMVIKRLEVYLIALNPTVGSEIQKMRPCLIVSPDEMNDNVRTVIIAPMTTKGTNYKTRVACEFDGKDGQIALDQIRTVDKSRLIKRLGELEKETGEEVLKVLREMFEE
ncbi:MAG: type II toxin-antitoxin system PemK/MazF family toxin [Pyrinomonadaceae bacterium]